MSNSDIKNVEDKRNMPISEEVGLKYIWAAIASFNVIYLLNLWLLDRTNQLLIDVFHFDDTWESAPVFGLTFGAIVTILAFILMLALIRRNKSEKWLERIPPLWVDIDIKSKLGKTWRRVTIALTLLFPLAAQLHFWLRLYEWQVWKNNAQAGLVGVWSYVSPEYFFHWDAYRYGDHSKRLTEDGFGGVSFLPLWEPLIMFILTVTLLVLFAKIILNHSNLGGGTSEES